MIPLRDSIPSERTPYVNWALMAANIAIFGYEFTLPPEHLNALIGQWALTPRELSFLHASPLGSLQRSPTLVTSMFMHAGPLHLIGNMVFLWIFGDNVEDRLGHVRYLLFYLICGLAAALAQVISAPGSAIPILGASGAIGGVMGAYMISYPRAHVLTLIVLFVFVRVVWIPAIFFLGLWFLLQLSQAFQSGAGDQGGVAFWAHIGGFAAGVGLILLARKRMPPPARESLERDPRSVLMRARHRMDRRRPWR